jgi:hypothetical protein
MLAVTKAHLFVFADAPVPTSSDLPDKVIGKNSPLLGPYHCP